MLAIAIKIGVDVRPLTHEEFDSLLLTAPTSETWAVRQLSDPYWHLTSTCLEQGGGTEDGRPMYAAFLLHENGKNVLWTIVNSGVRNQFSLYKHSKRIIKEWARKHGDIYATMPMGLRSNMKWTEKMGFRPIIQQNGFVTLKLQGE